MSIYKKLLEVQKEVGAISKDSKNPHFGNKYFDINSALETVKPILSDQELFLSQPLIDNKVYTILTDVETGESIESFLSLPEGERNPQKIGSCLSYYRRYTLVSLLGLQGEDDDGQLASQPIQEKQNKPKAKPNPSQEQWQKMIEKETSLETAEKHFTLSEEQRKILK